MQCNVFGLKSVFIPGCHVNAIQDDITNDERVCYPVRVAPQVREVHGPSFQEVPANKKNQNFIINTDRMVLRQRRFYFFSPLC